MALKQIQHLSSLLGLSLVGRHVDGVVLRRTNGSLEVVKSFQFSLTLDPLTNDPELVGRELRNQLDEAGIHEKRCAVGLPLNWAMTLHTKLPEVAEADIQSLLEVEAERGFPYAPADLAMATSRYNLPNGEKHASLVAVPKTHVAALEKVFEAAQLKPQTFSLGINVLQDGAVQGAKGSLIMVVGENGVELQLSCLGGVVALRALEGAVENTNGHPRIDVDQVIREIRITLGQLPLELRQQLDRIIVFGPAELAGLFIREVESAAREMHLAVEQGRVISIQGLPIRASRDDWAVMPLCLAAWRMAGKAATFEFLAPRLSPWRQAAARFSSRKILYVGVGAAAVALLVGGAFLVQQWRLSSLESRWRTLKPRVSQVEEWQRQTRKYRSWFDDSTRTMRILRQLTEVFPADGSVTAKTLEIKSMEEITCSGQASDNQSLLGVIDRLRSVAQIRDVKIQQIRGKSPMLFTLQFNWSEGTAHD